MWRGLLAAAALPLLGAKQEKPEFKKVPLDLLPTVEEKLVAASAYGDLAAVGELLAEGADPNAEPDYSASVAVRKEVIPPGTPLTAAVIGNQPRAIVALLEAGAEASAAPRRGSPGPSTSALGTAAVQNNPSLLKAFHKGGADLTTPLPEGFRPLHLAAWGMFVPKSGRARALGYLVEDEDGPRLDVNAAAVGPSAPRATVSRSTSAVSQSSPVKPAAQSHVKSCPRWKHVPLCWQGAEVHEVSSSTSVSQSLPL